MEENEIEEGIILDEDSELFALEPEEDDGYGGDLSEEAMEGFSSQCFLDGFSFPGDEKDWS